MRTTFIKKLIELAEVDPNIYLMIGDYGFSVVEPFKEKFNSRFINAGISEQNMIGVAAGLALAGKKVFVYSIVPFVTMRCFEQVRIDLCYQNLPVRIIGIAAGFAFGPAASTHHSIEDIALMSCLPNMTVISPANSFDLEALLPQANNLPGPVYFRLGRGGSGMAYPAFQNIELSRPAEILKSDKVLFLVTGEIFSVAFDIVKKLRDFGLDCGLINVHTIKPLKLDFILSKANFLQAIFTIEEHGLVGGLGQQVANFLCQNLDKKIIFKTFTAADQYFHEIGSRDYLLKKSGLEVEAICSEVLHILGTRENVIEKVKQYYL
ncbi:MAG: Transketolase subunit B [candidate division TM6 bacterium GW2011_GWF2_37_49]|nr:MAG: Transketolase subunit B [candidate division TM6 bacterium GW2011_GWF2_37_49]